MQPQESVDFAQQNKSSSFSNWWHCLFFGLPEEPSQSILIVVWFLLYKENCCHWWCWVKPSNSVPQGPILGPLIFTYMHNNILPNQHFNLRLYADDIILYVQGISPAQAIVDGFQVSRFIHRLHHHVHHCLQLNIKTSLPSYSATIF